MRHRHKKLWATTLICTFFLYHLTLANPVLVPQFLSGGTGRNIRHLPCVSRRTGETGVCMFAFTCAKANGTHLGTCIDRFYFGSCCKIDDEPNVLPQDNAIEDDPLLDSSKPFITSTSPHGLDSNVIPDNFDSISKPSGTKFPIQDTTFITKAPESTTFKTIDQTKTKPLKVVTKKPIAVSTTTESIRLSTFQTVQTGSEQKTSTTPEITSSKWPQSSTTFGSMTESQRPIQSTHFITTSSNSTTRFPTRPSPFSTSMTSSSPSSTYSRPHSSLPPSTLPFGHRNVTSKRPSSTVYGTRRPITTQAFTDEPDTVGTTIYDPTPIVDNSGISQATTHTLSSLQHSRPTPTFSTTQRAPSVTRFPPRNTTAAIPTFGTKLTSILNSSSASASAASASTSSSTKFTTPSANLTSTMSQEGQKPSTTRKPLKKPTKVTTKRPVATRKPATPTATRQPPTFGSSAQSTFMTTIPTTTYEVPGVIPLRNYTQSSSKWPVSTSSTATMTSSGSSSTASVTTKTPSSTAGDKFVSGSTGTKVTTPTKKPSTVTYKKNATSTTETRPTTTALSKFTVTTRKPVITTISLSPDTTKPPTSGAIHKFTTQKLRNSTTVSPITTREPIEYNVVTEATIITSAGVTVKSTALPMTTTARPVSLTSPVTQASMTRPAFQPRPSSPSTSSFTNKKNVTSWSRPTSTTESNEIDTEFDSQPDTTTATPGFVTWSSFSTETENSTRMPEYSSIVPVKPVSESATLRPAVSFATSPPTTTSTATTTTPTPTTRRTTTTAKTTTTTTTPIPTTTTTTTTTFQSTTQASTYVDTLSTIATVTVSPEFTEPPLPPINMSDFRDVCGRRLFSEPRIVNGTSSSFGKWPWQISLRQWRTSTYLHKCGAALLNENWAITAAHCVQNVLPGDLLLRIGEHDLSHEEEPYGFQERRVQIVASHPNFDPRTFEFDLALMRFYEPVLPFQPNILPVCVPDDDEDYVGQLAVVTGWGRLYEEGPLPPILQEVSVPVINNTACENMYRNAGYIEDIPRIFICAGWRKGGFDSCEGDSGGPLVVQRKRDNRWVLAGVISWGIGCAEPNQPGVYTRISEFREWINQILQF